MVFLCFVYTGFVLCSRWFIGLVSVFLVLGVDFENVLVIYFKFIISSNINYFF